MPADFIKGEHGLKSVHCETAGGYIWICLAKQAPDFSPFRSRSEAYLAAHRLGEAKVAVVPKAVAITTDTSPSAIAPPKDKPLINPRFSSPESSGLTVKVEKDQKEKVVLIVE